MHAKLIGGQQYDGLYGRIGQWEASTGATVKIVSKKNHFELDKEFKSDLAAGTTGWCVGSNHSSFAPQYPSLFADLSPFMDADEVAGFVPAMISASTVSGKLVMLPRAQFDVFLCLIIRNPCMKTMLKKQYLKPNTGMIWHRQRP